MGRVSGKVALVTGGASGIGRSCCEVLAREGAKVAVTDIDEAKGREVADAIKRNGGEAAFYRHDVTSEDEWVSVVGQVESDLGPLNILVNNAGIGIAGPIWEFSLADWRKQNAINLDGVFLGTKHGILSMRKAGSGSIVMISSLAGMEGAPFLAGYCATKGGVRLFTKAVAMECANAKDGIRVNSVHPGIIETPIWDGILPPGTNERPDLDAISSLAVPLGVKGYPLDIANGVLWLASDESRYVTGTELVIDGGLVTR